MTLRLLVLTLLLTAIVTGTARASCVPSTESQLLKRADAVFVGVVISARSSDDSAAFRILRVRKGRLRRGAITRVYPIPRLSSVTIGWSPQTGQRWRLYVVRKNGRWITNDCAGTRRSG